MGETALQQKRKLPKWAPWLFGYAGVLLCAVGLVYFWRVAFSLDKLPAVPLTLGAMGLATLLYAALVLVLRLCKDKLCAKAAACVFLLGLLFCFATAPLQAPDESDYFLRSYTISQGHFDAQYERGYPRDVRLLYDSFPAYQNHKVLYEKGELAPAGFVKYQQGLVSSTQLEDLHETYQFSVLPFVPQALGMLAARLLGFAALGQMYAGRLANLLCYVVLCYFTFKNCDKYRGVFFAFALLPLSLFIAASLSRDGILMGLCLYVVSFFCKKEIHTRDVVLAGLATLYATHIKPMNIVLAFVLLLIPEPRWKTKLHPWASVGAMVAAGLLLYWLLGSVMYDPAGPLVSGYPPQAEWPRGGGGTATNAAGQLALVFSNLPRFAAVTLLTLYEHAGFLFELGIFGWTDMALPLVGGLSVLSLSASSALGIQQKDDSKNTTVVALALAAVLYACAVLAGMYVAETDVGSIRINALQARYFLPCFLMLFMVASILLGKAVRPRLATAAAAARTQEVALWIAAGVALISVILVLQNGFIGQWVPKAEGGWQLVNLLGWQ